MHLKFLDNLSFFSSVLHFNSPFASVPVCHSSPLLPFLHPSTFCAPLQMRWVPKISNSKSAASYPQTCLPSHNAAPRFVQPLRLPFLCVYFPLLLSLNKAASPRAAELRNPVIVTMARIWGALHFHCKTWRLMHHYQTTQGQIAVNTHQNCKLRLDAALNLFSKRLSHLFSVKWSGGVDQMN